MEGQVVFLELVISSTVTDIPKEKLHLSWKKENQWTDDLRTNEHAEFSPLHNASFLEVQGKKRKEGTKWGEGKHLCTYLWECNPKSHSSYNSHICLHKTGHQVITALENKRYHSLYRPSLPRTHTHKYLILNGLGLDNISAVISNSVTFLFTQWMMESGGNTGPF